METQTIQYLTVEQAAQRLQMDPFTVRIKLRNKTLPGTKLPGGTWRIHPDELDAFIRSDSPVPRIDHNAGNNADPPKSAA